MTYILALLIPPVALLANRQPLHAIISLVLVAISVAIAVGLSIYSPLMIPPLHALIAIAIKRRHRLVEREITKAERQSDIPVFTRWRDRRRARRAERARLRAEAASRQNRA